jgi:hypothetical protein
MPLQCRSQRRIKIDIRRIRFWKNETKIMVFGQRVIWPIVNAASKVNTLHETLTQSTMPKAQRLLVHCQRYHCDDHADCPPCKGVGAQREHDLQWFNIAQGWPLSQGRLTSLEISEFVLRLCHQTECVFAKYRLTARIRYDCAGVTNTSEWLWRCL